MNIILYQATNTVNGKRYIGITKQGLRARKCEHCKDTATSKTKIGRALHKYGKDKFDFRTVVVCPTYEYAQALEARAIATYKPEYNIVRGGGGTVGYQHKTKSIEKMKRAHRANHRSGRGFGPGSKHTQESKDAMRVARSVAGWGQNKGRTASPEAVKNMSRAQQLAAKRPGRYDCMKNNKFALGNRHTPETVAKLRLAQKAAWERRRAEGRADRAKGRKLNLSPEERERRRLSAANARAAKAGKGTNTGELDNHILDLAIQSESR